MIYKPFFFLAIFTIALSRTTHAQSGPTPPDQWHMFKSASSYTLIIPSVSVGATDLVKIHGEFNIIYNHKWGFSVGGGIIKYPAPGLPDDYQSGLNLFGGNADYYENMGEVWARGIWNTKFSDKSPIRLVTQLGPSFIYSDKKIFTEKIKTDPWDGLFESNYSISYKSRSTVGASWSVGVDFPIVRSIGLNLNVNGNVNNIKSFVAGGVGIIFGVTDRNLLSKREKRRLQNK